VRQPQQVRGDIEAQVGALRVADRRLVEMLAEYNLANMDEIAAEIFRASEDAARRELKNIPPGVYYGAVESDGWDEKIRVQAKITVTHDGVTVDYSGSSHKCVLESMKHSITPTPTQSIHLNVCCRQVFQITTDLPGCSR